MVAVFNSSPWIFLSKLGIIELAIELFSEVFLPSSVNDEVLRRKDEASSALERLQITGSVKVIDARSSRLVKALGRRLGKGEAEAIAVALERDADLVVLDDHAARSEATRLGLEVKGTLGVIRRLMELGERCYFERRPCERGEQCFTVLGMSLRRQDKQDALNCEVNFR